MKLAVWADDSLRHELQVLLMGESLSARVKKPVYYRSYDDFIGNLPQVGCDAIVVACRGAEGMESARAARILLPHTPLIWLSDDRGFGPESYRIGCTYFSASPMTEHLLKTALDKCDRERRPIS